MPSTIPRRRLALATAALISPSLPAQVIIDPITVQASAVGPRVAEQRLESPLPFVGLDREEFTERPNANRLGDVINRLPGVFMGGPPTENKDIRLRGLDKEFTRFQYGAVQLPGAGEKREFQVNRLSPFSVGAVRALRSPTAEFESDGIAGRVIADPRPIPEARRLELLGHVGGVDDFDGEDWRASLGLGGPIAGPFSANLFLDATRFPLQKEKTKTKLNPDGSLKEREIEDEDKPTRSYNVTADLRYRYDSGAVHLRPMYLELEEDKDKRKVKIKADGSEELELEDELKEQTTLGATLENEHFFLNGMALETRVSYFETDETKDKDKAAFKAGALDKTEIEDEDKEDAFWEARSALTVPFELGLPHTVKLGAHGRLRERFRDKTKVEISPDGSTSDKTNPKDNYEIEEDYVAGFIQDELALAPRWTLLPGLRVEWVEQTARSGAGLERDETFLDVNPSAHLAWRTTDRLTLKLSGARTLNRPKFDEIAPFREERGDRFVEGNPELEPARAWNVDLSGLYHSNDLTLGLALFYKDINDVIEEAGTGEVIDGKDVFRIQNVGDGRIWGVELEQRLHFALLSPSLEGLSLWSNQAVFDSELTDASGRERPFNEQPESIINGGVDYHLAATGSTLSVAVKRIGELQKVGGQGEDETEAARTTLDLKATQSLGRRAEVFFEALNLTDAEKQKTKIQPNGEIELEEESVGRFFRVGLRARF